MIGFHPFDLAHPATKVKMLGDNEQAKCGIVSLDFFSAPSPPRTLL
jgi:hypothetical protein